MRNDDATSQWRDKDYHYDYPRTKEGKILDFKPGSELHQKLAAKIREDARAMWDFAAPVRKKTKEIRHNLDCVVPKWTREQVIAKDRAPDKPFDVMIPLTRACSEHYTAFAMSEFTSPYGNYELDGEGPDGMYQAAINETVLNAQGSWFRHDQHFINFFRSSAMNPVAAMVPVWSKHKAKNTANVGVDETLRQMIEEFIPDAVQGEMLELLEEQVLHEGNRLENIDSDLLLIHPQSKTGDFESQHRATCKGYILKGNAYDVVAREKDPEEFLMNGKYLADWCENGNGRTPYIDGGMFSNESGRSDNYNLSDSSTPNQNLSSDYFDGVRVWWWLRPKKWGLGESDEPELWAMLLAADEIIVECRPVNSWTGRSDLIMASVTNDGHYAYPTSMLMQVHGIQEFLNWDVRSFVGSKTKSLNGIVFANPDIFDNYDELIDRKDLGGIIWARPPKWRENIDIRTQIHQLVVSDPDPQWASNIAVFMGFVNQIFGTSPIMQGDMTGMPERPTVPGINTANDNASERMSLYMRSLRHQWYEPLVFQMGVNTQQYLQGDYWYNIIGSRLEQELQYEFGPSVTSLPVSPRDIGMSWRVNSQSHRQRAIQMQAMQNFVERMMSIPEIAMQTASIYGIDRILRYYMRLMGFKNIYAFANQHGNQINAQVLPDEQIMSMRDRGSVVPMNQGEMVA